MSRGTSDVVIYIIDDCDQVRTGLSRLLDAAGYRTASFDSAESFLANPPPDGPGCIILDVKLPGLSGPALQERLISQGLDAPVVFLSGHADVPTSVKAMKLGASDFLQKPVVGEKLLASVAAALEQQQQLRRERAQCAEARHNHKQLTAREKQVLSGVVAGKLNKQIADELGLHEQTIKQHRGSVMRKMKAASLADLVRMADRIGLPDHTVKPAA